MAQRRFRSINAPSALADGGTIDGSLLLNGENDGDILLQFDTPRPWAFKQRNSGATTALDLHADHNGKNFNITSPSDVVQFTFQPTDALDPTLIIYDQGGTDTASFFHDGTDFNLTVTNTSEWNVNTGIKIAKTSGPHITIRDSDSAGNSNAAVGWLRFEGNDSVRLGYIGWGSSGNQSLQLFNTYGAVELYNAGTAEASTQDSNGAGITSGLRVKDHTQTFRDVGFNVLPIRTNNASVTLDATHCGQVIYHNNSTAYTVTTEANTSTDFPIGGMTTIINHTATAYTVAQGSGTTTIWQDGSTGSAKTGTRTLASRGVMHIWRHSSAAYFVWGIGIT